jgi:hypothetical protein
MRIHNICTDSVNAIHTLSAKVVWEDCDRPSLDLFFRVRGEEAFFDASNYNPFLVACVSPALHYGEQRINIDGEVCPWLADNLTTMMAYFNHWYWYDQGRRPGDTVKIEAKHHVRHDSPRKPRVGSFFSGGVDSLYTLYKNKATIPEGHPGRISDAIFVHGFDFGNRPDRGTEEDAFEYFIKEFEPLLQEVKVNVIPVWTNVSALGTNSTDFWLREFMGPAMGAVAHALSGKLTDVLVSSSHDLYHLCPWGSHPLIEPRLSSFSLHVYHEAERVRRIDKVRALMEWQATLEHVRVCFFGGIGRLNCGVCEKCVRTKLELLCADKLRSIRAFENTNVNFRLILRCMNATPTRVAFYDELIHALPNAGYTSLALAVAIKRLHYQLKKYSDLRGTVARIDKNVLGGFLKNRRQILKRNARH